jgi:hypothetical protein
MAHFDIKRSGANEAISGHDVDSMMEELTDMVPAHLKGKALSLIKTIRQIDEASLKNRILNLIQSAR